MVERSQEGEGIQNMIKRYDSIKNVRSNLTDGGGRISCLGKFENEWRILVKKQKKKKAITFLYSRNE